MTSLSLALMTLLLSAPDGGSSGHGHGHHRKHGNPDDLAGYIAKMEDPSRDAWQRPDDVVAAIGVKADHVVCDIGAGPGYFALRFAAKARHVYAVDVEPKILEALRQRLVAAKRLNVTPVLAAEADPLIPSGACDLIVVVDTFHHFPDGVAYLRRLGQSLKPGGRLVNIDFHKRELPVGPSVESKVAREEFIAVAQKAGLEVIDEPTFLPHQYFLVMRVRTPR